MKSQRLLAVHAVSVSIARKPPISLIRLRANLDFQLLLAVHQVFRHRRALSGSRNGFSYLVVYSSRLICPPPPLLTRSAYRRRIRLFLWGTLTKIDVPSVASDHKYLRIRDLCKE